MSDWKVRVWIKIATKDMPDLIEKVSKYKKNIFTFDIGEKWVDLGRIEDYRVASRIISKW